MRAIKEVATRFIVIMLWLGAAHGGLPATAHADPDAWRGAKTAPLSTQPAAAHVQPQPAPPPQPPAQPGARPEPIYDRLPTEMRLAQLKAGIQPSKPSPYGRRGRSNSEPYARGGVPPTLKVEPLPPEARNDRLPQLKGEKVVEPAYAQSPPQIPKDMISEGSRRGELPSNMEEHARARLAEPSAPSKEVARAERAGGPAPDLKRLESVISGFERDLKELKTSGGPERERALLDRIDREVSQWSKKEMTARGYPTVGSIDPKTGNFETTGRERAIMLTSSVESANAFHAVHTTASDLRGAAKALVYEARSAQDKARVSHVESRKATVERAKAQAAGRVKPPKPLPRPPKGKK